MNKINVLNSLTHDNQENIRFIESKTTVITAIIGAVFVFYMYDIDNIINYFKYFGFINKTLLLITIIMSMFSSYFLFKVIFPVNNPKSKLPEKFKDYPNLYLTKEKLNKKHPNLIDYENSFMSEYSLKLAVELEYLKTSYIRNEKLKNFKRLVFTIILLVISFLIHVIKYKMEINEFILIGHCLTNHIN